MGTITLKESAESIKLLDGQGIQGVCAELGISFGCRKGVCGTCKVKVLEGGANLTKYSALEEEYFCELTDARLACQCYLISGDVTLSHS